MSEIRIEGRNVILAEGSARELFPMQNRQPACIGSRSSFCLAKEATARYALANQEGGDLSPELLVQELESLAAGTLRRLS
jgi:hypothetical protein